MILKNPLKVFSTPLFKNLHELPSEIQLSLVEVVAKAQKDHDIGTSSMLLIDAVGQNHNWVWKALLADEALNKQSLAAMVVQVHALLKKSDAG